MLPNLIGTILLVEILGAEDQAGLCAHIITTFSFFLFLVTIPVSLCMCVKVICIISGQQFNICTQGCSRIWESSYIQTWKIKSWRCKGSWIVLHHAMHWYIQKGGSQNSQLWCSSTRGKSQWTRTNVYATLKSLTGSKVSENWT